jgi:biotin carboxyl carrier protein
LTFEIEVGGRTRIVEIHRGPEGYKVTVDGAEHTVHVARAGPKWSLLVGPAKAGPHDETRKAVVGAELARPGRSYEIAILDGRAGDATIYVNGQPVPVAISERGGRRRRARAAGDAAATGGPQRVVAPMPGRIVKVLVKPGERVAARQGLVVVEAMKMENELRSPKAGTVSEVRVTEGMSVEANAVLVVVN